MTLPTYALGDAAPGNDSPTWLLRFHPPRYMARLHAPQPEGLILHLYPLGPPTPYPHKTRLAAIRRGLAYYARAAHDPLARSGVTTLIEHDTPPADLPRWLLCDTARRTFVLHAHPPHTLHTTRCTYVLDPGAVEIGTDTLRALHHDALRFRTAYEGAQTILEDDAQNAPPG